MFEQNPSLGPGASSFSSHLIEIIIMLLVAALLGYLIGSLLAKNKWKAVVDDLDNKLDVANKRIHEIEVDHRQQSHRVTILEEELRECGNQKVFLQEDIGIWRNKSHQYEDENKLLSNQLIELTAGSKNTVVKKSTPDETVEHPEKEKVDDLSQIEGVGPVINELLQSKGIRTFEQLSKTDLSTLEDYISTLESSGLHDPSTWMKQARLAAAKDFEALDDYKSYLVGGRDPEAMAGLEASGEYFGTKVKLNHLALIEGIGPKIEELFNAHGIYTWAKLAGTSIDHCREILSFGGPHYTMHDPTTWPQQAALAAGMQWKELKEFQDELFSGRV